MDLKPVYFSIFWSGQNWKIVICCKKVSKRQLFWNCFIKNSSFGLFFGFGSVKKRFFMPERSLFHTSNHSLKLFEAFWSFLKFVDAFWSFLKLCLKLWVNFSDILWTCKSKVAYKFSKSIFRRLLNAFWHRKIKEEINLDLVDQKSSIYKTKTYSISSKHWINRILVPMFDIAFLDIRI